MMQKSDRLNIEKIIYDKKRQFSIRKYESKEYD